jgi:hypothetical protein
MRKKLDKKALQRRDLGPGEDHNPGIVVLIARGSEVQRRARGSGEDHNNDKVEVAPGLITAAPDSGPGENHNLLTLHSTRLAQAAPELRSGEDHNDDMAIQFGLGDNCSAGAWAPVRIATPSGAR